MATEARSDVTSEAAPHVGRLRLELVVPEGAVLSATVEEVTAPGVLGEFGVLPGHVPFLSALKPGVFTYADAGKRTSLAVGAGYLQVGAIDRVRVLVDRAARPDQVDAAAAEKEIQTLTEEMKDLAEGPDLAQLRVRLDWARARLAVAGAAKGGGH